MANSELTKNQLLAALVLNYEELSTIFSQLPKIKRLKDDKLRRDRILSDLKYLINDGLDFTLEDMNITNLFKLIDKA